MPAAADDGRPGKAEKPPAESPLNTLFPIAPPPPTPPAAPGGGSDQPHVEVSVTNEPAGNKPHGAPESEADKMQKSQSEYFRQMQQMQAQTNEQQLMTAILKQDGDMTSALASIIKGGGRGIKDLAA